MASYRDLFAYADRQQRRRRDLRVAALVAAGMPIGDAVREAAGRSTPGASASAQPGSDALSANLLDTNFHPMSWPEVLAALVGADQQPRPRPDTTIADRLGLTPPKEHP